MHIEHLFPMSQLLTQLLVGGMAGAFIGSVAGYLLAHAEHRASNFKHRTSK